MLVAFADGSTTSGPRVLVEGILEVSTPEGRRGPSTVLSRPIGSPARAPLIGTSLWPLLPRGRGLNPRL